ncbi:MAG: lipopolysaccharide assembly protein LapA domain-containing protein [bacterium]
MRKFILFVLMVVFGGMFVLFLLSNRHMVILNFDPISLQSPFYGSPISMPLWLVMVLPLMIGYFLGAAGMYYSSSGTRRKASERKREIKRLQREVEIAAKGQQDQDQNLPALK